MGNHEMVDAMRPIVIYDGECRFCLWSVRRIQRIDRLNLFDYLPRQMPGLELVYPRLADSDFNTGMRLIVDTGQIYVGADAVYQIYRRIPPFHLLTWSYRLPVLHWVYRSLYALVARYRHLSGRVVCDTSACELPFGERSSDKTESDPVANS